VAPVGGEARGQVVESENHQPRVGRDRGGVRDTDDESADSRRSQTNADHWPASVFEPTRSYSAAVVEHAQPSGPQLDIGGLAMAIGFRFMLVTTDDEPVDLGVFLCAEPRWGVGDVFMLGRDRRNP
jgi:hypothetical protein